VEENQNREGAIGETCKDYARNSITKNRKEIISLKISD